LTALLVLTNLAILFLLGLTLSVVAKKLRVSNILLLILAGIIIGKITIQGIPLFNLTPVFLVAIAILTLVMVIFDGASRFRFKELDKLSTTALKLTGWFLLFNAILLTIFSNFLFFSEFTIHTILSSLILAIVVSGTDPVSVFLMLKSKANNVIQLLSVEAIINTPLIVLLPFIILDIKRNIAMQERVVTSLIGSIGPLLLQIVVGIGAGIIVGIVMFKAMKKFYSEQLSPIALLTAALLAYILAETLGGNGVLSVATLGLIFGSFYVRQKEELQEFSSMISNTLVILVFLLIGLIIDIPLSFGFAFKTFIIFIVLIASRSLAIMIATKRTEYNMKEKFFMSLSMPKGIAVAVVVFTFSLIGLTNLEVVAIEKTILDAIIYIMVYSLILSSIIDRFSQKFIRIKVEK
jgi:NhaP-type Na+/H+ or K+/H+ antiporter